MFRWFLVILLFFVLFSAALPWLQRLGIGKLPGDLKFRLFGREIFLPFTSTILLSFAAVGFGKLF